MVASKTIRWQIDCLAKLTEAPTSFVEQVHALFRKKGISLDEDATPYLTALEAAFRREETIRSQRHSRSPDDVQRERRTRQLQRVRRSLRGGAQERAAGSASETPSASTMSKVQREKWPMVPGPEELQ